MIVKSRVFNSGIYVHDIDGVQWWMGYGDGGWERYVNVRGGWKAVSPEEVPAEVKLVARLESAGR